MRLCILLLTMLFAGAAPAGAAAPIVPPENGIPPGVHPETGARPGNVIGTGSSLPRSEKSSNIGPSDTRSRIAPNLPTPAIGTEASPRDYLLAARIALVQGRTGEAQQALEMAETRLLDRSVPLFQTTTPVKNPVVDQIQTALHALSKGDRERAVQAIDAALKGV